MIDIELRETRPCEWDDMVSSLEGASFVQSWAYGEAKAKSGWHVERGHLVESGRTVAVAQVMLRRIPVLGGGFAWVNRGPLLVTEDKPQQDRSSLIEKAVAALHEHYVARRRFYLRIAPPWMPEEGSAEISELALIAMDRPGWASASIDLTSSVDDLRAALAGKWRNALGKAERLGVRIEENSNVNYFHEFLDEYRGVLDVKGFATSLTVDVLRGVRDHFPEPDALTVFRARHEGNPLGSALIVKYGRVAEYLAGTLLDAGRAMNAGQLLLWRAVCAMKARGACQFDLGGMDALRTPKGIYDFKKGLGGTPYRLANTSHSTAGGFRAGLAHMLVRRLERRVGQGN